MLPRRQRGQVLIVIFLGALMVGGVAGGSSVLFGGKRAHDLRKELQSLIPDSGRRESIEALVKAIEKEDGRLESARRHHEREILAAMERHDATARDFQALAAPADAVDAESRETLLDLRFKLRAALSDSEWRALFAPQGRK
jgi:uncharacterized membrane protein